MMTRDDLLTMNKTELTRLLGSSHPVDPATLDDTEFRGVSLGLPRFVERLTWKTFRKVFHRDPTTGVLRGWNVRIVQRGVDGPYEPMERRGEPKTFGHYRVVPMEGYRCPRPCPNGLMLDYGLGGNSALDFVRLLRDPVVAVNEGSADLLLGWSYLDLGILRLGTPSFFSLERDRPLTHRHGPPRPPR